MTTLQDLLRDLAHEAMSFEQLRSDGTDERSRTEIADDLSEEYINDIINRLIK